MASFALTGRYETFIKTQVESGRYNNASEVVRAGLRLLEDHEAARERWLADEIPKRLAEYRADPGIGIPAEEVFARLEAPRRAKSAERQ